MRTGEAVQEGAGHVVLLALAKGVDGRNENGRRRLIFDFHVLLCPKLWRVQGSGKMRIGWKKAQSQVESFPPEV